MRNASRSHNLISKDVVDNRLHLTPTSLLRYLSVRYNDGILSTSSTVQFTWKRLSSGKTHKTEFFVVESLPDADVINGDLGLEEALALNAG